MEKRLIPALDSSSGELMIHDFCKVVEIMSRKGLVKGRNVSRYGYYTIRL